MRILNCTLSTLLLVSLATATSAQTETIVSTAIKNELDAQIQNAIDTHRITESALLLALAEVEVKARKPSDVQAAESRATEEIDSELRAAVNLQRTDMQLETTSDSPHATSVLEKPGIADLLSLALDRGAIMKTTNGTGLTLSTTPYAIRTGFGARDTETAWKNAVVGRNLSFSATFSSTDVTKGDFSSFTSGEVKYVITGNRSPRDPDLLKKVRSDLSKKFLVADHLRDQACEPQLKSVDKAKIDMDAWLMDHRDASADEIHAHLLETVRTASGDPVMKQCVDVIIKGEQLIDIGLEDLTKATQAYLDDKGDQFSVAALFVRDATISDYYAAKLLYAHDFSMLTANVNAEASWNKSSTTSAGAAIQSLRAYSLELGMNSKAFAKGRLDGSASLKASRDEALDAKSVVIGEAKLNIHLNDVLRLPITLSYANRETETVKQGWQLNVGVNALLDEVLRRIK